MINIQLTTSSVSSPRRETQIDWWRWNNARDNQAESKGEEEKTQTLNDTSLSPL